VKWSESIFNFEPEGEILKGNHETPWRVFQIVVSILRALSAGKKDQGKA